ncbi:MAG: TraM recognition domain-containing protein [Gallionella sp.]|nr:TraM recognition domain-containing protein [Gallionella sp.]
MENQFLVMLLQMEQTVLSYVVWLGWLSVFLVLAFNLKPESRLHRIFWFASAMSVIAPVLHFTTRLILAYGTEGQFQLTIPKEEGILWAELWFGGIAVAMLWLRYGSHFWDRILAKFKKTSHLERNHKTDVREIHKFLPAAALEFQPLKYVNLSKGIFLGLDEDEKPIYINIPSSTSAPHIQVAGTTGAGKGVSLGVMAAQFLERGEAVFYCDPKNDEWAPHVLCSAAERTGKPFHFVNLNRPNGAQFNPFAGATEEEAFELFQAGFSLTRRGDPSDFYNIADRREAGITAKLMAEQNLNIAQAYAARREVLQDPATGAENFAGLLREMAETPSINAGLGDGVDLEKIIQDGGCVYVVGSMRNDIIKTVQRILLVRLIQLAERRDRLAGNLRPVCIVLDEVKYHLSRPALEGISAARDKNVHFVLAHQSLGDLRDCPNDMNPDAVVDAVVENCRIKICYRLLNPVTAEWFAAMSGTIQVDDEVRNVRRNVAQSETVLPERSIRQTERYFVDVNMLLNLPYAVGVIYGDGLPKFASIRPIQVEKSMKSISIKTVNGTSAPSAKDAIALG